MKNSITKSLVQDTLDRNNNKNKSVVSVHYIPFWSVFVMCLPGEQEVIQLYTNVLIIRSSTTSKQIPLWNEQPMSVWRDSARSRHPRPLQRSISQPNRPDAHRPAVTQTFRVGFTALRGSKDKWNSG